VEGIREIVGFTDGEDVVEGAADGIRFSSHRILILDES